MRPRGDGGADRLSIKSVLCLLSIFIMYSWLQLMVEHMVILSQEAGSDEYSDGVSSEVQKIIFISSV